jgi:hypothetical protein
MISSILPSGGAGMDNDSKTTTDCNREPDEERQNRRQFFNGLGKWSLAIVAAVAAFREGLHDVQNAIGSRFGASADAAGNPRQIATVFRPPGKYKKAAHIHAHTKYTRHTNQNIM